jgi:hypothetical protein
MIEYMFQRRLRLRVASVLLAGLLWVPLAAADPQPRNDSGQASCFSMEGEAIDCADQEFPHQDGAIGRDRAAGQGDLPKTGAGAAGFDFTKIATDGSTLPAGAPQGNAPGDWACTFDNHTGFLWEVKTRDGGPRHWQWAFGWYDPEPGNGGEPGEEFDPQPMCGFTLPCNTRAYVDHVNSIALCGRTDWRMPTRDELVTIVHYGASGEWAVDEDYFVMPSHAWTRDSALEPQDGSAQAVVFLDGHVEATPKGSGHSTPVLVSGEPFVSDGEPPACGKRENPEIFPSTAGAFEFLDEGLVRDHRTELVWDRCSVGQEVAGEGEKIWCDGEGQEMGWAEALQRVRELNKQNNRGHDDWRLPNIKELQSIVERRCAMPVLDTRVFPNQNPEPLWSSTSYQWQGQTGQAWVLQMEMGHMMALDKHASQRIRVVRGGSAEDDYTGPASFRIGGTLSGMVGTGLVLELAAADGGSITVNANGVFHFALGVPDGTTYEVTRASGPVPAQECTIVNGSGTVAGAHVADVEVICSPPAPAQIEVSPAALAFAVAPGQTTAGELTIGNVGGGILHWSISTAHASGGLATFGVPALDCSDPAGLIVHDDGSAENGYGGGSNWRIGMVLVERFVPPSWPASIGSFCLPLTAQGASAAEFEIVVFRDNGPDGAPGTELGSLQASVTGIPTYPVATPQWFQFDLSPLFTTIDHGGLYIGMRGLPATPNVFVLIDESEGRPPGIGEGYRYGNGIWQRLVDVPGRENYRATLMRAAPAPAQDLPVGCDDPHAVPWLDVGQRSGQTLAGETSDVSVAINARGLAAGEYHATLCIDSDGGAGVVEVPVQLNVVASHVVTPLAGEHGDIDPATPQAVEHGATARFMLEADPGWQVAAVGGTCGGSLDGDVFTTKPVIADCSVEASFEPLPPTTYTVTPSADEHGLVSPSQPLAVVEGEVATLRVGAAVGWRVARVEGSCGGALDGVVFTTAPVGADCTVEVVTEPDPEPDPGLIFSDGFGD